MPSIESSRSRRNAPQANAENDQQNRSSGRRASSTGLRKIIRVLMWLLIVLFVLNRNLNQILAADRGEYQEDREAPPVEYTIKTDKGDFNYLVLNMIWPVTVYAQLLNGLSHPVACNVANCQDRLLNFVNAHGYKFTIHGLWPSNTELELGRGPRNCNPTDLTKYGTRKFPLPYSRAISRIEGIRRYWPSFLGREESREAAGQLNEPQLGFWETQWSRHGKCAAKIKLLMTSCIQYFDHAVRLARDLDNVQDKLMQDDLWFGPGNGPTIGQLVDFFEDRTGAYGYSVQINHERRLRFRDDRRANWLESISFCFDLQLRPRDCPNVVHPYEGRVLLPTLASLSDVQIAPRAPPAPDPADDPRFR